jgi:hypothetical protein
LPLTGLKNNHYCVFQNSKEETVKIILLLVLISTTLMVGISSAQEHWTEGPVWGCSAYRTKDGQFDNYMKYLRENYLPSSEESKKEGLILDTKMFVQDPATPNDWDVLICTLYPSYGKAMDYSKEDDDKLKAIAAKQYKTSDEEKQREATKKRYDMRTFLGRTYPREVKLRPAQ